MVWVHSQHVFGYDGANSYCRLVAPLHPVTPREAREGGGQASGQGSNKRIIYAFEMEMDDVV